MTLPKLSYSVLEAAAATGLSKSHIERAIADGQLKAKSSTEKKRDSAHGGKRLILAGELQRYLDELVDA